MKKNEKQIKTLKMNINLGIAVISFSCILLIFIDYLGLFGLIVGIRYTTKVKKHLKELEEEK